MKTIFFIIQKEFRQIFRNKAMLPIIFLMPIIQILILSNAATFEVKNIRIGFYDKDHSQVSRSLISKFEASEYFKVKHFYQNSTEAQTALEGGKVDVVLEIPPHFEREVIQHNKVQIFVQLDAINGAAAGVANGYVGQIVKSFNLEMQKEWAGFVQQVPAAKNIQLIPSFWFNSELNYKIYMVPGIIVLLVTMITFILSGMNIVREREVGTLEQINVTPIKKYQFIIGKLLPFWILGMFILFFAMNIGRFVFAVPVLGNPLVILAFASIYILLFLGMGFFVSNFTETQQQAMFIAYFFMVIFILMSGLFTPIESMPAWAQKITEFNPVRYFIEVIRMVMLKGSGFEDVKMQFFKIGIYAVTMNVLAIISYHKTN